MCISHKTNPKTHHIPPTHMPHTCHKHIIHAGISETLHTYRHPPGTTHIYRWHFGWVWREAFSCFILYLCLRENNSAGCATRETLICKDWTSFFQNLFGHTLLCLRVYSWLWTPGMTPGGVLRDYSGCQGWTWVKAKCPIYWTASVLLERMLFVRTIW